MNGKPTVVVESEGVALIHWFILLNVAQPSIEDPEFDVTFREVNIFKTSHAFPASVLQQANIKFCEWKVVLHLANMNIAVENCVDEMFIRRAQVKTRICSKDVSRRESNLPRIYGFDHKTGRQEVDRSEQW